MNFFFSSQTKLIPWTSSLGLYNFYDAVGSLALWKATNNTSTLFCTIWRSFTDSFVTSLSIQLFAADFHQLAEATSIAQHVHIFMARMIVIQSLTISYVSFPWLDRGRGAFWFSVAGPCLFLLAMKVSMRWMLLFMLDWLAHTGDAGSRIVSGEASLASRLASRQ